MNRTITAALLLAAAQAIKISTTQEAPKELPQEPEITKDCTQEVIYDFEVKRESQGVDVHFDLPVGMEKDDVKEYWVLMDYDKEFKSERDKSPLYLEWWQLDYQQQQTTYGVEAVIPLKKCSKRRSPCPLPGKREKELFKYINEKDESKALKTLNVDFCPADLTLEGLHQGFSSDASALHMAIEYNMHILAEALIEAGADVSERAPGLHNQAPLAWACHGSVTENPALIKALISAGADPEQQDDGGWTALHQCAAEDRADSITAILNAKPNTDLNIRNAGDRTALGTAEHKGKLKAADVLKAKGATEQ